MVLRICALAMVFACYAAIYGEEVGDLRVAYAMASGAMLLVALHG